MTMSSHKVTALHLERKAYLYVRQSSMQQVFQNTESTEFGPKISGKLIVLINSRRTRCDSVCCETSHGIA